MVSAHEDGGFCLSPSNPSSVCVGDVTDARTIVYTTKYQCLPRMKDLSRLQEPIAIIGRYGLPVNDDLSLVRGTSQAPIFMGDCDPPDILVFGWLREHLPIDWHGVNDDFLVRHGIRNYEWIRIPLSDSERKRFRISPNSVPTTESLWGNTVVR